MVLGELNTIVKLKLKSKQTGNEYEVECRRHVEVHAWSKVIPNREFLHQIHIMRIFRVLKCDLSVRKSFQVVHKGFETSLDVFDN